MHGLILAGGEGARLAREGVETPKALLSVEGEPLIVRLLGQLSALGCETLTCMVRADFTAVFDELARRQFERPLCTIACRTPSSLHTLVAGFEQVGPGAVFCTMVDSVMPPRDWHTVYAGAQAALARGADAVLAVTPYVDDESPLYVRTSEDGFVQGFGDGKAASPEKEPRVTGGVYAFSSAARRAAAEALGRGTIRMRGFLADYAAQHAQIATITVARIIDVDHASDLRLANAWLGSAGQETRRGGEELQQPSRNRADA